MQPSGEASFARARPPRPALCVLLALHAVLACTWPPRIASAQDAGCVAPAAGAACLAGARTQRDASALDAPTRDVAGADPPARDASATTVSVAFLASSPARPPRPASASTPADWAGVRRGAWSGVRWGALIGAVVGAGWCAVDAECRDEGGGGIFETAVFTGVSGAAVGALVGAVMGAVRD